MHDPLHITEIFPVGTAGFYPLADTGGTHYALTNLDAPKQRLVRIDISDPKPERWHTVIAESDAVLDQAAVFNSRIIAKHLDNVSHRISIYDLTGQRLSTVDLGASRSVGRVVRKLPPATAWATRTQTLSVLGSTDGNSFTTLKAGAGYVFNPASANTATVTFPAATARYVRVTITGNTGWPAGQLSEFEVHPS